MPGAGGLRASYFKGVDSPPLLERTIGEQLDRIAARFPERDALIVRHQGVRWSYSEFKERIERLAAGLLTLGIGPGERVGIWAPNGSEWVLTQFATAKIGAILVCINPAYRLFELEYALNQSGCRALIAAERFKSSEYLEMLRSLAPELDSSEPGCLRSEQLPTLEAVIRMGSGRSRGMLNFDDVCDRAGPAQRAHLVARQAAQSARDVINIQYTSGTTGRPKGAALTHYNILNNAHIVADGMRFSELDRLCIPVPLYHCFGMVIGMLACLSKGAAAVLPSAGFDAGATLAAVQAERCTALHGVPTMFIAELEHPDFERYDLSSLRTGIMAGAPCPVKVMRAVLSRMHLSEILIAYGQTECSPVNHMTLADDPLKKRVETVGKPGPHLEVKLVGPDGRTVPTGARGDICTRGYSVMSGYWQDPGRTAETIDADGWLHSGDIGVMDEQGYVRVVGRLKDMIIRGGENIYPREIEEYLYTHPQIQDVQVVGVADERYGEEVCAWVIPEAGSELNAEDVIDYCRGRIAHFKIPRHVRIVREFPLTVTGKVQKFKMRETMERELAGAQPAD